MRKETESERQPRPEVLLTKEVPPKPSATAEDLSSVANDTDEKAIANVTRAKVPAIAGNDGFKLDKPPAAGLDCCLQSVSHHQSRSNSTELSGAIMFDFVGTDNSVHQFLQNPNRRTVEHVIVMEDRFYCAHNAVQSAQTGEDAVTDRFDRIGHGGVVQKQRHSRTWCLAPHQPG